MRICKKAMEENAYQIQQEGNIQNLLSIFLWAFQIQLYKLRNIYFGDSGKGLLGHDVVEIVHADGAVTV